MLFVNIFFVCFIVFFEEQYCFNEFGRMFPFIFFVVLGTIALILMQMLFFLLNFAKLCPKIDVY